MTKLFSAAAAIGAALLLSDMSHAQPVAYHDDAGVVVQDRTGQNGRFRRAMALYERGMYGRAREIFSDVASESDSFEAEGYAVLCSVKMKVPGYGPYAEAFIGKYPYASAVSQIRFAHALNLFDSQDYVNASVEFESLSRYSVWRSQMPEYLFKKAYCDFETGNYERAALRFNELEKHPESDYSAPARYMLGYIRYEQKNFAEAAEWFSKSASDIRFASMSKYYMAECRFMLKDYAYLTAEGPGMLDSVPEECRPKLMRMISEAFFVQGDTKEARYYYDRNESSSASRQASPKTRADYFYAGSLLYAVEDYQGAIDNFSMMTDRTDSIGQAANYKMGYSFIRTRNKVAALDAFKAAASVAFDPAIAEDASYNHAKLSFDLNSDASVFRSYLERYPESGKKEMIYSYIAVAALQNHDYAGAIEAYDNIDVLDEGMKDNYMKANYLRASELIAKGSYRSAVPCLKAAAYYSDRRGMFNQMSRYWLAESYYRDDNFSMALSMFTELYNISALYGHEESYLIPYNMAYCHFKTENYPSAEKWFSEYLSGDRVTWKKDAQLRYADCLFMQRQYGEAADAYGTVLKSYFDVNDIYPYYQAAMASGLAGDDARKIELLKNVENADAGAYFYPEAMFELGRSYVRSGDVEKASGCYDRLIREVKDSTFVARSLIELGMIARNKGEYELSLSRYKTVVEKMPLSGYADDALLAIESIYQSMNEPRKYLDYIDSIGKSSLKTEDEKEMMIFNAAEQIYLSENYQKALVSLQSYLDSYPQGAKVPQAWFYMAECYKSLGKADQACDYYVKVMESGDGSYSELACLNFANLAYGLQRYEDAWRAYVSLGEMASLENNRYAAMLGMMRSSFRARLYEESLSSADKVLADSRSDADIRREAEYVKAKSFLATSRRDEAYAIFARLASWPGTPEGAEAAYLMILDSYDRGDFEEVETKVYSFSDSSTGQTYWLAKAFIVLGDSFVERGEYEQAEATFRSILDGYQASAAGDDVHDNVTMRLDKLKEIMQQAAAQNE